MTKAVNIADLAKVDNAIILPSGNTASRPTDNIVGTMRFNTSTNYMEFYNGSL